MRCRRECDHPVTRTQGHFEWLSSFEQRQNLASTAPISIHARESVARSAANASCFLAEAQRSHGMPEGL